MYNQKKMIISTKHAILKNGLLLARLLLHSCIYHCVQELADQSPDLSRYPDQACVVMSIHANHSDVFLKKKKKKHLFIIACSPQPVAVHLLPKLSVKVIRRNFVCRKASARSQSVTVP